MREPEWQPMHVHVTSYTSILPLFHGTIVYYTLATSAQPLAIRTVESQWLLARAHNKTGLLLLVYVYVAVYVDD